MVGICGGYQMLGDAIADPAHVESAAEFEEVCANCGTYSPAKAWQQRLIEEPPALVFWPKSISVMGAITLANILFITILYKELKLATFDSALAATLGFRPALLHYALMVLVSVTAVGAFDAVGSVLVVAFVVIPAAAAYLLTDRLWLMLFIAPAIGALSAYTGYDLARGSFLGVIDLGWNTSISAAMVIMAFVFFMMTWVLSPRYGLVAAILRRQRQKRSFEVQMLLGHVRNHQDAPDAETELAIGTLHEHMGWPREKLDRVMRRASGQGLISQNGIARLTERGEAQVTRFMRETFR